MAFRLFGVNVEIQVTFWVATFLLGSGLLSGGSFNPQQAVLWTAVVLVSILVHEFGHAVAIKLQGIEPEIQLHWLGGETRYRVLLPLSRPKQIFISLAGPFAGFFFGAVLLAVAHFVLGTHRFVGLHWQPIQQLRPSNTLTIVLGQLFFVNFGWGIVNLIPALPYDGGRVLEAALGPKRERITLMISLVVAVAAAALFLHWRINLAAMLFAMSAYHSVRRLWMEDVHELPAVHAAPREPHVPGNIQAKLAEARRAIEIEDFAAARSFANEAVRLAGESDVPLPRVKVQAYEVLGWAAQMLGDADEAGRWIKAARQHGEPDVALVAAVMIARGDSAGARKLLEQARASGDDRKEIVGPLIQLLISAGEVPRAAAVAFDIVDSLSDDDARQMAEIAFGERAFDWAARLHEAVFARTGDADDAYQAARAHAADGALDRALDYLGQAVGAGFSDRARAWSDAALEPLRAGHKLETVVPRP